MSNRIPRRWLTLLAGWLFRIEHPWLAAVSIGLWQRFSSLDLSDARKQQFRSVHDCFTRELRPGARTIDPNPRLLVSPCDGIVGSSGKIRAGQVLQCKGLNYSLTDLLGDAALADTYRDGTYVTLRLTPTMYHRFHAPDDCTLERVRYFSGDTWNVNPIALQKIERLFCRNERATLRCRLHADGAVLTMVPVAAILVASIRLHCPEVRLHLRYQGPQVIVTNHPLTRGEEMGWFEQGSTILMFVPTGYSLVNSVSEGSRVRVGEALLTRQGHSKSSNDAVSAHA